MATDSQLYLEPAQRCLSGPELDGDRAESARRALARQELEADLEAAGEALEVLTPSPVLQRTGLSYGA